MGLFWQNEANFFLFLQRLAFLLRRKEEAAGLTEGAQVPRGAPFSAAVSRRSSGSLRTPEDKQQVVRRADDADGADANAATVQFGFQPVNFNFSVGGINCLGKS